MGMVENTKLRRNLMQNGFNEMVINHVYHSSNMKSKADYTVREIYFSLSIFQKTRPFFFRVCLSLVNLGCACLK